MIDKLSKHLPFAIFIVALAYYCLLASYSYTWLYASQDSGDWLAASSIWIVPQPIGSPLYVFLGHFLNLFPGSLEIKMTLLLSALPAAITISLVYLVVLRLSGSKFIAVASSLILLGAEIFLTQSLILEEYTLTAMFLTLAYLMYLKDYKKLTLVALGCATAVHILGLIFFILWTYILWSERKVWWKHLWIYLLIGILPYIYIPILMYLNSPPFMAGYWSFEALYQYLFRTSNAIVFQISVFDFPARLGIGLGLIVGCLAIAIIPLVLAFRKPYDNAKKILLISVLFPIIYYILCLDPSTWTFLTFSLPFLAILCSIGLQRLYNKQQRVVIAGAILLVLLNSFFFNTGWLQASNNPAQDVKSQLEALPANSVVLTYPGAYSMAVYYINSTSRTDIIPLVWQETGNGTMIWSLEDTKIQYQDYCSWLYEQYGIQKDVPLYQVAWCLEQGYPVYIGAPEWVYEGGMGDVAWTMALQYWLEIEGSGRIREVTDVRLSTSQNIL